MTKGKWKNCKFPSTILKSTGKLIFTVIRWFGCKKNSYERCQPLSGLYLNECPLECNLVTSAKVWNSSNFIMVIVGSEDVKGDI